MLCMVTHQSDGDLNLSQLTDTLLTHSSTWLSDELVKFRLSHMKHIEPSILSAASSVCVHVASVVTCLCVMLMSVITTQHISSSLC